MGKNKYYVVWNGVCPGIYSSWADCQRQIHNFEGAIFKSFDTQEEAEKAYNSSPYLYIGANPPQKTCSCSSLNSSQAITPERLFSQTIPSEAIVVDAACSGNPGPMEYRGIYLRTGLQIFHFGPVYGTNNIGEFLAIVHALALTKQKGISTPIYSDSKNAISWIKQKKCKTKLERTTHTEALFQMIERAENWLRNNAYDNPIIKWNTKEWGEIPADFGRK